ncbi:MAG TPA: NAD(P)/FAD-dependent oxidoreductase [Pseudolysinimonas sp.]|nr:NAD(P)/FAD-dependent oxidoreductase [Pseudolysinimonas sp.]
MANGEEVRIADVVVIGGGFAGVVAARDLSHAGLDVVLVEARDRLGGRTWSKESSLGHRLEMGGAYVHWLQPHTWSEIMAHGLEVETMPEIPTAYWIADGEVRRESIDVFAGNLAPGLTGLAEGAREAFPFPYQPFPLTEAAKRADATSVGERIAELGLDADQLALARSYASVLFHTSPDEGSLAHVLKLMALCGGDWGLLIEASSGFQLAGGTGALIDAIQSRSTAEVRLSTPIASVTTDGGHVDVVSTTGEIVQARQVIITAPQNAVSSITFDPPLAPEKQAALAEGILAKGTKIWMLAKGKLDPFVAWAADGHPLTLTDWHYDQDGNTILMSFGPVDPRVDPSDVRAVETALREFLPDVELLAVDCQDWATDPYAQETWWAPRVGQVTKGFQDMLVPEERVRFAGGDYAYGWAGFIDGAIESGRRAATEVVDAIRGS